jgi:hypothetical protein
MTPAAIVSSVIVVISGALVCVAGTLHWIRMKPKARLLKQTEDEFYTNDL